MSSERNGMPADGPVDEAAHRVRDFLVDQGIPEAEVAQAFEDDVVHLLVADCMVLPETPRYSMLEVVEASGLERTTLERLWRAMGFPEVAEDEKAFSELDLQAVRAAGAFVGAGLVGFEEMIQLTRVAGSSMARIADAEVAATYLLGDSADSLASADLLVTSEGFPLASTARLLEYVWRRHMRAALRRAAVVRSSHHNGLDDGGWTNLVVGFADLVGFTAQAQQLTQAALAELVSRFEALAHDTVVDHGGRVVKMIGDEVMFVVDEPVAAVELALALAEAYADDELLSDVRVGLAGGDVLARDGDAYGATVNLAHRIVNVARPGSVVVNDAVHDALERDERFEWRTIGGRYLKDIGRVNLHVARRLDAGEGLADRARRVGEERVRLLVSESVRERFEQRVRGSGRG